jgi:hypothetical protein
MKRLIPIFLLGMLLAVTCRFSVKVQEPEQPEQPMAPLGRDILFLDRGEERPGRLEQIKPDGTYVFTDLDGKTQEYPSDHVLRIEFHRRRPDDQARKSSDIKDDILQKALEQKVTCELYPNAAYVTIYDFLKIEIDKNLSYTMTRRTIKKVLTRRGLAIANDYVDYLADSTTADLLFARTITPEDDVMHITDGTIEDGSKYGAYPQYDNSRRLKWSLGNVKEGCWIDSCYRLKHKSLSMLNPLYEAFFLGSIEPVIRREALVTAPPGTEIIVTGVLTEGNDGISRFEKSTPEGKAYSFVSCNMPRLESEYLMPPYADVLPWMVVSVQDSWERIGTEYAGRIAELLPGKDSPVARKAEELAADKESEMEKAQAIYDFIVRDVGLVDIGPDEYSYLPVEPAKVLAAGQANRLDKAFLLHSMLASVGIESSLLLAYRRDYGRLALENPSLKPMNTPIVRLIADDSECYCCPTTQTVPFGYIPPGIQGSPALEAVAASKGLTNLPILPAKTEGNVTQTEITLQPDGRIRVKRTERPQGEEETVWRQWSNLTREEIALEFETIVATIHPNARLLFCTARNVDKLDKPVVIEYWYEVENYALTAGGELLVLRLPELDYSASDIEKYERDYPMFWGSRCRVENTMVLKLPEGYRARSLPEPVKSYGNTKPFMWYEASFVEEENTVVFKDSFERTSVFEPASSYPVFIKVTKDKAEMAKKWLVIEKTE